MAKKMTTGVCWEDCDFRKMGLIPKVLTLDEAPDDEVIRRKTYVFCAWIQDWENKGMNSLGCPIVEQQIFIKYDSLKWVNPDHRQIFINL